MPRLDQVLVDRGLCESREKAKRAILAGRVRVNQQRAQKASDAASEADEITLEAPEKYVSRGGHKLEHALAHFQIVVTGLAAIDLGASTGGFTDCLLQAGARLVYAVDVGHGQLAWTLRQDHRVVVMEKTNARNLAPSGMGKNFRPVDLITADCSFISLKKILPPTIPLLAAGSKVVALVKPQFEAGKAEADKGAGVITDPAVHARVLQELERFVATELPALAWRGGLE
jgi:23S rRNA (cytidine1920-2'-O)/16S rRNA (cytidine1409-2'-O)-methyltransferase